MTMRSRSFTLREKLYMPKEIETMELIEPVIIGGGQAGLATSYIFLSRTSC
jgi:hypothetical protein